MSHRRSANGELIGIIDQLFDQNDTLTLVAAATVTLARKVFQYQITKGVIAADSTLKLPANPKHGDEVWLKDLHAGAGNLVLDGNGNTIDLVAVPLVIEPNKEGKYLKFDSTEGWLILSSV